MLGEQVLVDGEAQHPAWSPDGKWIVYASAKSRDMELYRVSADGGRPERLTDSPGRDWHPAWLSDEQIVFATERDGVEQLAVLHLADGSVTLLQGLPVPASWPAVSPDGTWLAFSAAPQGDWDLYRVNLDGGQAVPDTLLILTQSAGAEIAPAWHPSGQGLVFAASRSGSLNLYAITNGGQSESLLLSSGYHLWAPSWLADGRLLFQTFEGGAMKIGLLDLVDGSVTSVETGLTEPAWPISQPMGR
jgi:TolB protein